MGTGQNLARLVLRLVCGLTTLEIARAFLVSETTMAQRLSRAKSKIADAGIPFEIPEPHFWPERLDAVLATIEIAYAKAHEDAAASGPHAHFAVEMLELTRTLVQLMPGEAEPAALAALVRFAEARRPARLDAQGLMVPLSEQDPMRWQRPLIDEANDYLSRAVAIDPNQVSVIQAQIHAAWCSRGDLREPPPWPKVLALYDALLFRRDDAMVRLNRIVAVAEVKGVETALSNLEALDRDLLRDFAPYHAVRADLLRRAGAAARPTKPTTPLLPKFRRAPNANGSRDREIASWSIDKGRRHTTGLPKIRAKKRFCNAALPTFTCARLGQKRPPEPAL